MAQTFQEKTILIAENQSIDQISLILDGSVEIKTPFGSIELQKGDILGLLDLSAVTHSYSYIAKTKVTLSTTAYQGCDSLSDLLANNKEIYALSPKSMIKQVSSLLDLVQYIQYEAENSYQFLISSYEDYKTYSYENLIAFKPLPDIDNVLPPEQEEHLHTWLVNYYQSLRNLNKDAQRIFENNPDLSAALLLHSSRDSLEIGNVGAVLTVYQEQLLQYIFNDEELDFFDLYSDLCLRITKTKELNANISSSFHQLVNYLEYNEKIDQTFWSTRFKKYEESLAATKKAAEGTKVLPTSSNALTNSLDQILAFSDSSYEFCLSFKQAVASYKDLEDRSDISDDACDLYKKLTSLFYDLYTSIFQVCLTEDDIPPIIRMFLYFGYVDEDLCGLEHSTFLYDHIAEIKSKPEHGVYTLFDWLQAIYKGEKKPSRNEFDVDFSSHLHELQVNGKIDKTTEFKMNNDPASKVMYELINMFPSTNKVTYGKIANFTPLLSEHNILRPLEDLLLYEEQIYETLVNITAVDHSAYCREVLYSDPSIGIQREFIQTEILPDIILMPNCGSRGVMWQEIEGRRRNTPARMMLPILSINDIQVILLRLTGEFRWEMCKRVQGSRWNDVTDKSLTSAYFDYVQFYRKNSDLSVEMKTKVKLALARVQNSFKKAFIQDYLQYMNFEKNGIPKLNKVSRNIFFTYCPFTKEYREKMGHNPLFAEGLNTYALHIKKDLHRYDLMKKKFEANGLELPAEIKKQIAFLNK